MEFNEKLQQLRHHKSLTQEELAAALFVSRTAVSKWESGRGYPNIDSLKAIAVFFGVTVDELLSGEEILTISEQECIQKENRFRDIAYGLLDICTIMLFFLPLFKQQVNGVLQSVSLLQLAEVAVYLKTAYFVGVVGIVIIGVLILALQNCENKLWMNSKSKLSLLINTACVFLFIISQQPYASSLLLVFLVIKVILLLKR